MLDLKTTVGEGVNETRVSTVLLVRFGTGYETCIFYDGNPLKSSEVVERYATESEAIAGHYKWVNEIRTKVM